MPSQGQTVKPPHAKKTLGLNRAGRQGRTGAEGLLDTKALGESLWEVPIVKRLKLLTLEMSENLFTTYADL